jgi:hypothetical protein
MIYGLAMPCLLNAMPCVVKALGGRAGARATASKG